ncbi:testis-specific serine/threonine-protein kinase 1 [Electrophorus electricus]|uniref:testis-specific serine/threonine-protein kinase 1 n=1 Tax=Electrophorus electricus TaxID=8005 RepID=UPI0015D01CDE|nr:testis-specific serine/threonine-protein kinase 1 [Electrophorus electricus]
MGDWWLLKTRGYVVGLTLGEGSYAKVKSAFSKRLKRNVAVKIINRKKASPEFLDKFLPRELDILTSLNHCNIIQSYEVFESSEGKVYMVMELGVQGDLLQLIQDRLCLPEDFSKKLFHQLSLAVKFLHDLDIAHRDLKCENLLLDKNFNLKVSDFGFSKRLDYEGGRMVLCKTFCGSTAYAAPEVLEAIPYDPKVYDVWSMGVVLFIMVCGSMPYDDSNVRKMLRLQKQHQLEFPRSKTLPAEYKDLMYRILHPDVTKRIRVHKILEHDWLQAKPKTADTTQSQQDGASTSKGFHKTTSRVTPHEPDHPKDRV